jgi:hypothetical protein
MNLEKEGLVDEKECIKMMDKCVSDIDQKIIEMSDMLNDSGKTVFKWGISLKQARYCVSAPPTSPKYRQYIDIICKISNCLCLR